jgi:DNA-binding NtrC family response regulator
LLYVVLECSRPSAGGARYDLGEVGEIVIGRGTERVVERDADGRRCTLRLPDRLVSSRHARLAKEDGAWRFEDLGSTNGSRYEGRPVRSAQVQGPAILEVGGTFLWFDPEAMIPSAGARDTDFDKRAREPLGLATLVPGYEAALGDLAAVALAPVPVLLIGETGTGKELLARAVHEISGRSGPFVAVNCGALPDTLIESQLFGHVRGAFSGAAKDEPGLVRTSHKGTLFLDEIGELPRPSQATLLRVLQEREVLPVGGTKAVAVDLRVVAATHQRLAELPADVFRPDLYARLAGFTLRVPALRERRPDLGIVIAGVLQQIAASQPAGRGVRLTPALGRALVLYGWPHNARELYQALSVGAVLAGEGALDLAHLPEPVRASLTAPAPAVPPPASSRRAAPAAPPPTDDAAPGSADTALRAEIARHLETHRGNVSEVSRVMGKTRMQIHRWMKRFGLDPAAYRRG